MNEGDVAEWSGGSPQSSIGWFESTHRLKTITMIHSNSISIRENIRRLEKRIAKTCRLAGRDPESVTVVLATKTVPPEHMLEASSCGYHIVAENRVQEAEEKIEALGDQRQELEWHFIGHLQSNKVNKVIRFASMVQSIDRMKIVRKMNRRLKKVDQTMDVLIQVNVSGEPGKYGIDPSKTIPFIEKTASFDRLRIKGLMTIGLFSDDWPKVRSGYRLLREIRDEIDARDIPGVEMKHLSMGMTNDFEIAIEEGATMIRPGRAIFGERTTPESYYWPGIETPEQKSKS